MSQTADSEPDPADLTLLLRRGGQGDAESEGRFVALVYNEMRKMARKHMRSESLGGTLQTTALVREAYLRLFQRPIELAGSLALLRRGQPHHAPGAGGLRARPTGDEAQRRHRG